MTEVPESAPTDSAQSPQVSEETLNPTASQVGCFAVMVGLVLLLMGRREAMGRLFFGPK